MFVNGKEVIWSPQPGSQTLFLSCPIFECLYSGTRGPGKALHLDTIVPTPNGFKRHGDLKIGDKLYGKNGQEITVIEYHYKSKRECFKLYLENNIEIIADKEHLWFFNDYFIGNTDYLKILSDTIIIYIPSIEKKLKLLNIEYSGVYDCNCIKVDAKDGLYCITKDYVITHNTDALLMDFLQHVGQGYGVEWRGILFRQSYPQLSDIISKSKKWFYRIFPKAKFNETKHSWVFPDGEELLLRHMNRHEDYENFHGHSYGWIGWEELSNWSDSNCYESMKSCCRSLIKEIPRKYRSTTNPYGSGHSWIRSYFVDPAPFGTVIVDKKTGNKRVCIHGTLKENKKLLEADPEYIQRLNSITDPNKRKAWIDGSWDIVAGSAIADVWDERIHVIQPFEIPKEWYCDRSFDWGSTAPFAVCWFAESNGETVETKYGDLYYPKGSIIMIAEYYGWNGKPNEGCRMLASDIARNIIKFERNFPYYKNRFKPGPADTQIYAVSNGISIADEMARIGVVWKAADKRQGSRVLSLERFKELLNNALIKNDKPGFYVFNTCRHFLRTVPFLPRDEKNPDDIDDNTESHIYDCVRYRVFTKKIQSFRQEII